MEVGFLKLEERLEQRPAATSCCGKLTLQQGVVLGCVYYICRMLLNVAYPFMLVADPIPRVCVFAHPDPGCPNFCSGSGSLFGDREACDPPPVGTCTVGECVVADLPTGEKCPEKVTKCDGGGGTGVCPPCFKQQMHHILMEKKGCEAYNGTFEQVTHSESKDDPAGAESVVHLILISMAQLLVGVLALFALVSAYNRDAAKLRPLFRSIVVLIFVEAVTQVVSLFAVYSSCKDESYSASDGQGRFDKMRCTMTPAGDKMMFDAGHHQISCETSHIFGLDPLNSVVVSVLQIGLNCYFARVLYSFEREVRAADEG